MSKSESRNQKRKEFVEAIVVRNEPVVLAARIFKIPLRTAFNWLALYRSGGWHALNEKSKKGRPRKVSGEDMRWLYDAITQGNPLNYKFEFCLWSLPVIRGLLKQERQVTLSKSSISRLLNHLGLSPQRPVYKSYKQNPKKVISYLEDDFPNAIAQAKRHKAQLYFVDEAAVRSDSHRGSTWGKRGETPVVKDSGGRFGFKLISAVTPRGDMRFQFIEKRMNSELFIRFLTKLRKDSARPILVIADNARYHHSKKVQAFLKENEGSIMIAFLPAYSPELNPDEQVWNHAKLQLGKRAIKNESEMKKCLLSIMRSIQKRKALIRSFFNMPDTKYINLTFGG